jgi:hypothetical protein
MGVETNGGFEFQPGAWVRGNFRSPAPYLLIVGLNVSNNFAWVLQSICV